MRKIRLVFGLVLFFSVTFQVSAQWFWQNSSPPNTIYSSICFIDSNYGWVGGHELGNLKGVIARTTNSGTNWSFDFYDDFWGISSISFVDTLTGWAVGPNNPDTAQVYGYFIYKTTNGGRDWIRQPVVSDILLWSVQFINANTGWAVGGNIIKTNDGGNNWETQLTDSVGLSSVNFINPNLGWAVGDNDVILNTNDGGVNWVYQRSQAVRRLTAVKFINENVGWAVGDSGRILKTIDGGSNWFLQRNGTTDQLFSVSFIDENNGWVTGVNEDGQTLIYVLLKTTNGGNSWEDQVLPDNPLSYAIHFFNENIGWVSGYDGAILKTTTGGVIPVELINFSASVNINDVLLHWSTASETNNQGFEIQRKTYSARLSNQENPSEWKQIGFVDGNGTTTEKQNYLYTDKDLENGKYSYRLKQIDYDGSFEFSNEVEVLLGTPNKFALLQNYPNPFNPDTKISYQLPVAGIVTLKIFDVLGKEVTTLVNEEKQAGSYTEEFNNNMRLSSGVYFYQLKVGDFIETKKMILLK